MTDKQNNSYPVIPLKNMVLFPGVVAPLFVGRRCSLAALENDFYIDGERYILITAQKDDKTDSPNANQLHKVGVLAKVMQLVTLPDNNVKLLVEATHRVKLHKLNKQNESFTADYEIQPDEPIENIESANENRDKAIETFKEYVKSNKKLSSEALNIISENKNPAQISFNIASHLTSKLSNIQDLLEITNVEKRLSYLIATIEAELSVIETEQKVQNRVKKQMEKTQRDYYLNEQMKAIQKELGDGDELSDVAELEKRIKKTKLTKEAKEKADNELKKLKQMNPMSAEASVSRTYIDTLLAMPWGKRTKDKIKVSKAQEILERDHYGLEKVKDRVLEHLAIQERAKKIKGPILCLVGPPGVGKTSLARSVADSMGRKFTKFSLGGVRDEAEIRGHRKTYLGSMPGKVMNMLKKAKSANPVMLLDEIDKLNSDFRGDPSSALLEVLDPEQNCKFVDHYLEVEFDLSDTMFIATANTMEIPSPLLDRMEVIRIPGYIEDEKIEIAKRHLIPKQLKDHGIKEGEWQIEDDAILDLIRYYTKESGVRSLERELASLIRKSLKQILQNEEVTSVYIKPEDLKDYLGVRKYRFGKAENEDQVGVATGLAYTEVGGDLLSTEAVQLPGEGKIKATGKLGEVMQESAQTAFSYFKFKAKEFNVTPEDYKNSDIHLHVPEGATPKDGPSAGIAIFTTLVSLMTDVAVSKDVAMTGEITLRGRVLPIGGLKEKLLGAHRGGVKKVLIPKENVKDLEEVPSTIKEAIEIIPVEGAMEVLSHALKPSSKQSNMHKLLEPYYNNTEQTGKLDDNVVAH